ncbi:hypothetical protein TWF696_004087 [Orbilia brochopaga]|uniref:Peptidase S8/S53 domain-containing protein n=1 Tax=Orbilia brochopaga TaxID=3140254 RepID=A0AAV9V5T5_9PEZI
MSILFVESPLCTHSSSGIILTGLKLDAWGITDIESDVGAEMVKIESELFRKPVRGIAYSDDSSAQATRRKRRGFRIRKSAQRDLQSQSSSIGGNHSSSHAFHKRRLRQTEFRGDFADIRYYSKPPGVAPFEWASQPLYHESSEGRGIDIFVLDTGFAEDAKLSEEFEKPIKNKQIKGWIFPHSPRNIEGLPMDYSYDELDKSDESNFHGTKVISKIIGRRSGFARKANIWVGVVTDDWGVYSPIYIIDVLFQILEIIDRETEKNPNYQAIINMSCVLRLHRRGAELDLYPDSVVTLEEKKYIEANARIADIVLYQLGQRQNVIIVTGSGNDHLLAADKGWPITEWPAKRGGIIRNLVVIGSSNIRGKINAYSEAEFVKVYALSEYLAVPKFVVNSEFDQIPVENAEGTQAYLAQAGVSFCKLSTCTAVAL